MSTSDGDQGGRAEVWRAREHLEDVEARVRAVEARLDAVAHVSDADTTFSAAQDAELSALRIQAIFLADERAEAHDALGHMLLQQYRRDLLALGRPLDDGSIPLGLAARCAYFRRTYIALLAPWPALAAEAETSFPVTSARSPHNLQG